MINTTDLFLGFIIGVISAAVVATAITVPNSKYKELIKEHQVLAENYRMCSKALTDMMDDATSSRYGYKYDPKGTVGNIKIERNGTTCAGYLTVTNKKSGSESYCDRATSDCVLTEDDSISMTALCPESTQVNLMLKRK